MTMKDDLASIQHRGMMGASGKPDRAAGLRPQPPTASSQSSIPSALRCYDAGRDGFSNARLLMAASSIASAAAGKCSELAYGAWNPRFCDADAAAPALAFFRDLSRVIDHYADQAAQAMSAGTAEAGTGSGRKPASAVGKADAPNPSGNPSQGEDHHARD